MPTHVRVAVIGGGVVGCSVLYHLTKRGCHDVVLLERAELTAGSTWHAAGGMHTLNGDSNVAALQKYTIELYKELESLEGAACGVHRPGCLYLASNERELDFFKFERAKAKVLGTELDYIDLAEAKRLNPLLDTSFFKAAMFDPNDGHVDPSGVTNAMAKGARDGGAKIMRHTPVQGLRRLTGGEWELSTPNGVFIAEYVVNAGGLWAREVGHLFGVELPIVPMEHQYLLTNDIPELEALGREIPVGVDFLGGHYFRQERKGLLLGTYEKNCRHWSVNGTPPDFGVELLSPDLDRLSDELQKAMERLPALGTAGIKKVVNGGMVFSPDGNPIIGPLAGMPMAFVAAGCMAGFSQAGGVGLAVANWIVDGEPGMDVFAMDVARFGDFATKPYVLAKTEENYQRRMIIPCPNEELQATRPYFTSPLFETFTARGARFGQAAGWEVPLWFSGSSLEAKETPSFRRSSAFPFVGEECHAVRKSAGIWETSSYCKIEVTGEAIKVWLDRIVANAVPAVGRIAVTPLLTERGRLLGDVTVLRLEEKRIWLIGSPAAESLYIRWLRQHSVPGITIASVTRQWSGLSLTGPRARDILQAVTRSDVSSDGLPFLAVRKMNVGLASAFVARISFTGELGYEIYVDPSAARHLYLALHEQGQPYGVRDFGVRALNSLRLEKGYPGWGREITQDFLPGEAGLGKLVRPEKKSFCGKDAFIAAGNLRQRHLRIIRIETAEADPTGGEPVLANGQPIASLTSGAHSYTFNCGLGLAYVPAAHAESRLEVQILAERHPARILLEPPYDPRGQLMRS